MGLYGGRQTIPPHRIHRTSSLLLALGEDGFVGAPLFIWGHKQSYMAISFGGFIFTV